METVEQFRFWKILADLRRHINEQQKERDELLAMVKKVAEWNAKYQSSRIYSHVDIIRIAGEMNAINRDGQGNSHQI
jgi:hypothetical protein